MHSCTFHPHARRTVSQLTYLPTCSGFSLITLITYINFSYVSFANRPLLSQHSMSADGAPARFALLLHGKIGRLNMTASEAVRDHTGASRELITLCSRTHLHFIVAANSGSAGGVDVTGHRSNPTDHQQIDRMTPRHPSRVHCQVFVHTWNPDSGAFIDASYGPHLRASKHQPVEQRNNQCREQGGPDFGHLSLRRLIFAPAYAPASAKSAALTKASPSLGQSAAWSPAWAGHTGALFTT